MPRGRRRSPSDADLDLSMTMTEAIQEYDISNDVFDEAEALGLTEMTRPNNPEGDPYEGGIPPNLHELSTHEMVEWLSITTRWFEYINDALAAASTRHHQAEEQTRAARMFLIKQQKEERGPSAAKKYLDDAEIETNPVYVRLRARQLRESSLVKILNKAKETAENNRRAISNAVRSREEGRGPARREDNVRGAKRDFGQRRKGRG